MIDKRKFYINGKWVAPVKPNDFVYLKQVYITGTSDEPRIYIRPLNSTNENGYTNATVGFSSVRTSPQVDSDDNLIGLFNSFEKEGEITIMENIDPIINLIMIFVLACIIGYYVIWGVTSALHSPLMAVTNAISSVIIVGALIAAGPEDFNFSSIMGFFAIILASVNIFGGFLVTQRMLQMYKKKKK